ncbi:MAG: class I SAM-dependent RNA methyltransferase [Candidatus Hydrogenedentes bacterium]|nr:class I SAM-dependent RNA methyltransferase [Candidatus Hydrogenedentota bacterium]
MTHNLTITAVAHGGHGVARVEGQVCFVAYGLPGDTVRARIVKRSKGVLWAVIDELLEASPDRIPAHCPVYGICGACTWLHFAYPAQGEWKRRIVRESLARLARIEIDVAWADDSNHRLRYRTRAEFHGDGEHLGFYATASHDVVDVTACPLCHPRLNTALATLRALKPDGSVEVVVNPEGDDVLVWTRSHIRGLESAFAHAQHPGSEEARASFLFDGVPVVNGAFSQSSLLLNRVLVRTVHDAVGDAASVLDLYCGTGNLSLGLARERDVTGIDHNRAAVEAARAIGAGDYRAGNERAFHEAIREQAWDAIILDPPRTGAREMAPALARCEARRLVYVSCDPATLARDTKVLIEGGWCMERATAVDLFPNTPHIETVCTFARAG